MLLTNASHIRSLSVTGGFLDGLSLEFLPGLNCIIGARGTGKTTLLEFIRFALKATPEDSAGKKYLEALLRGGTVKLTIQSKEGLAYTISRSQNGDPIVLDSRGRTTDIVSAASIFKADIFSQNQVEGIAGDAAQRLALLDSFKAEQMNGVADAIRQLEGSLSANATECRSLQKGITEAEDELGALETIEARLEELGAGAGDGANELNKAHADKSLRTRELQALKDAAKGISDCQSGVLALTSRIQRQVLPLFSQEIVDGPNSAEFRKLADDLRAAGQSVDAQMEQARRTLADAQNQIAAASAKVTGLHRAQELAYQEVMARHKEAMQQSSERVALEARRNALLTRKRQYDQDSGALRHLKSERARMLKSLSELRNKRFALRQEIASGINEKLNPLIRVTVHQFGNTAKYQEILERSLKNAGVQHRSIALKIAKAIAPDDLAALVFKAEAGALAERAEISPDQARKVTATLANSDALLDIEAAGLDDMPTISLQDGERFKDSQELSTGQKCTAILPILLMDNDAPLLIDQPEDNLDNSFVFSAVVRRLRAVKTSRQLILITHNPNIPVLGDAERVIVMKSTGARAFAERAGTVDECKGEIVTILEGGEEAFKERKRRYDY